jgi:hypothetical protein
LKQEINQGVFKISRCVICEKATSGSLEFCKNHFHEFKEDIVEKKPWIKTLKNDAQRERRRRDKEYNDVSLDAILDHQFNDY